MVTRVVRTNTKGADNFTGSNSAEIIYGWNPNAPPEPLGLSAVRVATGLSQPLFATAPVGDTGRLFVVEKTGLIRVMNLPTGQIDPTPFLNVASQITTENEQGLLGLAFHPGFAQNHKLYVYLSTANGDVELREYQTSATNPNVVDPASQRLVLRIDFSSATNHRGGWIGFGPEGYLYAGVGDSANSANAQNLANPLGKILRMDVNGGDSYPADPNRNYAVPPDNPVQFDGIAGTAERSAIYAIGLRNPWRESFDAAGRLFIADVGQNTVEEVNLGRAGANYGWGRGTAQDDGPIIPADPRYTNPIYSYEHGSLGGSITGGYVYDGPNPALQGQYVFGDFVRGSISTLSDAGGSWQATDRTGQIAVDTGSIGSVSSFGRDAAGNLYIVDIDGDLYRLVPSGANRIWATACPAGAEPISSSAATATTFSAAALAPIGWRVAMAAIGCRAIPATMLSGAETATTSPAAATARTGSTAAMATIAYREIPATTPSWASPATTTSMAALVMTAWRAAPETISFMPVRATTV